MPRRDQRIMLGLAALTVLLAVVQSATGISGDVLLATPALILLLPLLAGRYVGEDGIARLSAFLARPRPRPVAVRAAHAAGASSPWRSPSAGRRRCSSRAERPGLLTERGAREPVRPSVPSSIRCLGEPCPACVWSSRCRRCSR
jgi:hypothetical protein